MPVERSGQAIRVMINLVNWQQEEPTGCGGGRQLSMDGTSRVTGDSHARFCERLGVRFPGPTRRDQQWSPYRPTEREPVLAPSSWRSYVCQQTPLIHARTSARRAQSAAQEISASQGAPLQQIRPCCHYSTYESPS